MLGAFETDLTVNGLKQAATNLNQSKLMAERQMQAVWVLLMELC